VAYDFLVWLFGSGIATLIAFLPIQLTYYNNELFIEARLSNPITERTQKLACQGLIFGIEYDCIIIINDAKTFKSIKSNKVSFRELQWRVNDLPIKEQQIQAVEGAAQFKFHGFRFDEGDEMFVYIKASIMPDSAFTLTTGLKTSILWNNYEPRVEKKYVFSKGVFSVK
jgi:hypothetical protein